MVSKSKPPARVGVSKHEKADTSEGDDALMQDDDASNLEGDIEYDGNKSTDKNPATTTPTSVDDFPDGWDKLLGLTKQCLALKRRKPEHYNILQMILVILESQTGQFTSAQVGPLKTRAKQEFSKSKGDREGVSSDLLEGCSWTEEFGRDITDEILRKLRLSDLAERDVAGNAVAYTQPTLQAFGFPLNAKRKHAADTEDDNVPPPPAKRQQVTAGTKTGKKAVSQPTGKHGAKSRNVKPKLVPTGTPRVPFKLPDFYSMSAADLSNITTLHDDRIAVREGIERYLGISFIDEYLNTPFYTGSYSEKLKGHDGKDVLDRDSPPISDIYQIFEVIASKLLEMPNFKTACSTFEGSGLRIFTMCSGTESPILSLQLLESALARLGFSNFSIEHLASAEIEPFKQAYIQRNFQPPILFRDVTEFGEKDTQPHTAFGGVASQPDDVHILVAGSSCVDYSRLNNKPKTFGQPGHSYDTFEGVARYADFHRPTIIIIENVKTAPWVEIERYWNKMGYFTIHVKLDTKNHYLPQTRERGYIVAFDMRRGDEIKFDFETAKRIFLQALKALEQRASSPYSDFTFPDDHPELRMAEQVIAKVQIDGNQDKSTPWVRCRLRHANFRHVNELGNLRPQTHWRSNGRCEFPDSGWIFWAQMQVERVSDLMDINLLWSVKTKNFDPHNKRVLDTSQNVDRTLNSLAYGIYPCITPTGQPMDTFRGGPIFSKENLILQGIPVEKLSLNKESSRQLQDLAGNAMTSTVVGSVMFSAIVASVQTRRVKGNSSKSEKIGLLKDYGVDSRASTALQVIKRPGKDTLDFDKLVSGCDGLALIRETISTRSLGELSIEQLEQARNSLLLCKCEILRIVKPKEFKICQSCGHTACVNCAGIPTHNYKDYDAISQSKHEDPTKFMDFMRSILPPFLETSMDYNAAMKFEDDLKSAKDFMEHNPRCTDEDAKQPSDDDFTKYHHAVVSALSGIVYLRDIRHDRTWRAIYSSSTAMLELCIYPQATSEQATSGFLDLPQLKIEWRLYAQPSREEPGRCWIRDILSHPVARLKTSANNIFEGTWELWKPSMRLVELQISGEAPIDAWEKTLGLQDGKTRQLSVFSRLHISADNTEVLKQDSKSYYEALNKICGTYQLEQSCGGASGTLHRKVESFSSDGPATFFFLNPKNDQSSLLDRFAFSNAHERLPLGVNRHKIAEMARGWRPSTQNIDVEIANTFKCRILDDWTFTDALGFKPDAGESLGPLDVWSPESLGSYFNAATECTAVSTLVLAKLPAIEFTTFNSWQTGYEYTIELIDKPHALREYQWLLKQLPNVLPIDKQYSINSSNCISSDEDMDSCSTLCIPPSPKKEWILCKSNMPKAKKMIIKPVEDSKSATEYELALKKRPSPITAKLHWRGDHGLFVININVLTLIHRVCGRMDYPIQNIVSSWALRKIPSIEVTPIFPTLTLPHDDGRATWPYDPTLYSNSVDPNIFGSHKLWRGQQQTLYWMYDTERGRKTWKEWESEDVSLPALNVRLEVDAKYEKIVKGGIIADQVGAGKTTTSLALIHHDIQTQARINTQKLPKYLSSGKIPSSATLILVPANLIGQWEKEIGKCFKDIPNFQKNHLQVFRSFQSLSNKSFNQLREAHIILAPWNLFEAENYWTELRDTCWAANVPKKAGRGLQDWLDNAMNDLADLTKASNGCTSMSNFFNQRKLNGEAKKERYSQFQAYREIKKGKKGSKNDVGDSTVDWNHDSLKDWKGRKGSVFPLLHFFQFRRLIVDEFTYLTGKSLIAILKIAATFRWMLSGTPPLTTFDNINTMARLLDTQITTQDEKEGIFSFEKIKKNVHGGDTSYAEEFSKQIASPSAAWNQKRNDLANLFVKNFVQQNPAPQAEVKLFEHFIGVEMCPVELCIYMNTYHSLIRQTVKFKGTQKVQDNSDRQIWFMNVLQQHPNAEAALMCCCIEFFNALVRDRANVTDLKICLEVASSKQIVINQLSEIILYALKVLYYIFESHHLDDHTPLPVLGTEHFQVPAYLDSVRDGDIGDVLVQEIVSGLICVARLNPVKPMSSSAEEEVIEEEAQKDSKESEDQAQDNSEVKTDREDENENEIEADVEMKDAIEKDNQDSIDAKKAKKIDKTADKMKAIGKDLNTRATILEDLTRQLTEQVRHLRLYDTVARLLINQGRQECCCCQKVTSAKDLKILGLCGHSTCIVCFETSPTILNNPEGCVVAGCLASAHDSNLPAIHYDKIGVVPKFNSKMAAVVKQLKAILNTTKEEKVIIFIQFASIQHQLTASLDANDIAYADGTIKPKETITNFKTGPGPKAKNAKVDRVLILNVDSVDAAGWNLQMCNHVMFVTPLQARTNAEYKSTMEQAIGRAFRYGQKRDVHVYHFITCNTVEVGVLETERRRRFIQSNDGYDLVLEAEAVGKEDLCGLGVEFLVRNKECGEEEDEAEE